jgi:hypothetical protein
MDSNVDLDVWLFWRNQDREEHVTQVNEIRTKAERLDSRNRRWRLLTVLLVILLVAAEAWQVWRQEAILERAGDLLTIAAFVYVACRFRKQRMAARPVVLGRSNGLEFYRAELLRQRDLSKDSWGYLLPFAPGVALSLFGRGIENRTTGQVVALAAFGVGLFFCIAWWNAHMARKLQSEINAVDAE